MLQILLLSLLVAGASCLYFLHRFFPEQRLHATRSDGRLGLVLAAGEDDAPLSGGTDIIFVHGLGSNPVTAWRSYSPDQEEENSRRPFFAKSLEKDVCWVTDFLPDNLREQGRRKDRIFFYNYDSYWYRNAVKVQLLDLARQMLQAIKDRIRDTPEAQRRRLVFVTHSYGGLLVKQAILQAISEPLFSDIAHTTKGIVFLGTPHRGTVFSVVGLAIALFMRPFGSDTSTLFELSHNSSTLLELDDRFNNFIEEKRVHAVSFWEEKPTTIGIGPFSIKQFPAPKNSAELYAQGDFVLNLPLPLNHLEMNKFNDPQSYGYQTVCNRLLAILNPIKKQICMTPYKKVDSYLERTELSQELDRHLVHPLSRTNSMQVAVVCGFGGAGKTQVVLDFVERHRTEFNPILWIDASSFATIQSSFESCAHNLQLKIAPQLQPSNDLEKHPAVVETLNCLAERDGEDKQWLMIIDNADEDSKRHMESILPKAQFGNVIVISQHSHTQSLSHAYPRLHVGLLSQTEARDMMLKHLVVSPSQEYSEEVTSIVNKISERIEYLALAVDFVGAYIFQEELDGRPTDDTSVLQSALQNVLEEMNCHRDEIMDWPNSHSPYEKAVSAVWRQAFRAIEQKYPAYVSSFLLFISAFDGTSIEEELFLLASQAFKEMQDEGMLSKQSLPLWLDDLTSTRSDGVTWDKFYFDRATKVLTRYRLISLQTCNGQKKLSLHRLVKLGVEQELRLRDWGELYLTFCGAIGYRLTHGGEVRADHESCHVYLRHVGSAMYIMQLSPKISLNPSLEQAQLWLNMASVASGKGLHEAARLIYTDMVEALRKQLPWNDERLLDAISELAWCHTSLGDDNMAVELFKEVRDARALTFGECHSRTVGAMRNFALALSYVNKPRRALRICFKMIQLLTEAYGPTHDDTVAMYNATARILSRNHRSEKAAVLFLACYNIHVLKYGKEHPLVLLYLSGLAMSYQNQQKFDQALEIYTEILNIRKKTLPHDGDEVLDVMRSISFCYEDMNDIETAKRIQQEVNDLEDNKLKRLGWRKDEL